MARGRRSRLGDQLTRRYLLAWQCGYRLAGTGVDLYAELATGQHDLGSALTLEEREAYEYLLPQTWWVQWWRGWNQRMEDDA